MVDILLSIFIMFSGFVNFILCMFLIYLYLKYKSKLSLKMNILLMIYFFLFFSATLLGYMHGEGTQAIGASEQILNTELNENIEWIYRSSVFINSGMGVVMNLLLIQCVLENK